MKASCFLKKIHMENGKCQLKRQNSCNSFKSSSLNSSSRASLFETWWLAGRVFLKKVFGTSKPASRHTPHVTRVHLSKKKNVQKKQVAICMRQLQNLQLGMKELNLDCWRYQWKKSPKLVGLVGNSRFFQVPRCHIFGFHPIVFWQMVFFGSVNFTLW